MSYGVMKKDEDFFIEGTDEKMNLYVHSRFGTYAMEWPESVEYGGELYIWDGKVPTPENYSKHYASSAVYKHQPKTKVVEETSWLPIPPDLKETREMFVVKAIGVYFGSVKKYTSDPYCVWYENGQFVRWPHKDFQPTHYLKLPK